LYIQTLDDVQAALDLISSSDLIAYDTETTGLNVRKDKVIGFGCHNGSTGFYFPLYTYDPLLEQLQPTAIRNEANVLLRALQSKKLIMFNASFDARVTFSSLNVDLVPALYADAMLLKHTCDEDFPFGLKEIATKLWGASVKDEKEAMQASIKANGGTAKEYYKADAELIGKYCLQDCNLTMRIFKHYDALLGD
jgi:DNA polymerase-1